MKDLVQCTVTCDDFHHWLLCVKTPATVHMEKEPSALLIKLEKSPSVLYLYRTSTVQDRGISWDNSMLFCGVFNKQSQALYLTKDALSICTDGQNRLVTTVEPSMSGEISGRINQRVEEIIANDRGNISVKKITESPALRDLQYYQEHGARESAIQLIFSDGVPDIRFHSDYKLDILPEAAFIAYIQDPENFVKEEAEQYIKANGERFLLQFLRNDALLEQYQALMQDTGNPIHRMKAITDAVKASGAKTVAATVQKDGMELTFRAVANSLTGHRNFYSTYNIPAQDRRIFEQMFGRYADFCAEDITRITYGKRTLYEAPAIQSEDMTEGMMMGGIS